MILSCLSCQSFIINIFVPVLSTPKTPDICISHHSSSAGISSSMYRISDILISVESLPLNTSLMKCASTCICTISSAPLNTPQKIFEYHNSSCARPSSGSSTKSAKGFSSKIRENCLLSLVQFVIVGVMLRNILNPTWNRELLALISGAEQRYLRNHLRCFPKIRTSPHSVGLRKVILDQPQADVVAHLVKLLIDFNVVAFVIFA
jgi:hypothetical protein